MTYSKCAFLDIEPAGRSLIGCPESTLSKYVGARGEGGEGKGKQPHIKIKEMLAEKKRGNLEFNTAITDAPDRIPGVFAACTERFWNVRQTVPCSVAEGRDDM